MGCGEPDARAEYTVLRFLDFFQNARIDRTHDFRDGQRLPLVRRQGLECRLGFSIVLMGLDHFEAEDRMEGLILLLLEEYRLGAAELLEVFLRQIDAALGSVGPDVPQNVC